MLTSISYAFVHAGLLGLFATGSPTYATTVPTTDFSCEGRVPGGLNNQVVKGVVCGYFCGFFP